MWPATLWTLPVQVRLPSGSMLQQLVMWLVVVVWWWQLLLVVVVWWWWLLVVLVAACDKHSDAHGQYHPWWCLWRSR